MVAQFFHVFTIALCILLSSCSQQEEAPLHAGSAQVDDDLDAITQTIQNTKTYQARSTIRSAYANKTDKNDPQVQSAIVDLAEGTLEFYETLEVGLDANQIKAARYTAKSHIEKSPVRYYFTEDEALLWLEDEIKVAFKKAFAARYPDIK